MPKILSLQELREWVEELILFSFFFSFLLFIFLKSLASNSILLAIQMLRFSVFHIIELDNYAASGIAQANSKSYGVLQSPTVYFSEFSVSVIYTKLSHSIAENLQITGLQKGLCIPNYLLKAQALSSHTQLQEVSSLCV